MSGRLRKSRHKAIFVITTDQDNPLASSSGRKAFYSAFTTFNLAVMGSSVLPMPYALSHTGALIGLATMLLVALCNDFTSMLMVNNAYETGLDSYESLALWAGGPNWKVFTQVTLIALLWGPNSGGLSLMGDVAQVMCDRAFGNPPTIGYLLGHSLSSSSSSSSNSTMASAGAVAAAGSSAAALAGSFAGASSYTLVPDSLLHSTNLGWLLNGQVLMVLMTICAVYPLSCQKHMRSLEGAAGAGLLIVAALCGLLGYKAWSQGWPAIADGQFPLWSLQVTADLPEAFSLLGFAFYLQPLMMPIIREMPEGKTGRNALTAAVHASVLGSCLVLYAGTGFFGAALFGTNTRGNVMINDILGGSRLGFGVVYGAMMLYLAAGAAASQYPLRAAIDMAIMGARVPMTTTRAMCIQGVTLTVSLCIALMNPGGAEKIYALVGASGVCIVCYVLPVWFHFHLMHVRRQAAKNQEAAAAAPSSPDTLSVPLMYASPHSSASSLAALAAAAAATAAGIGRASSSSSSSYSSLSLVSRFRLFWLWLRSAVQVLLPLLVMCIGIGFSVAAMYVAVRNIINGS